MNELIQNFGALGRRRLAILGGTAIGLIGALAIGATIATAPDYRAIATDLTASEASQVMSALEAGGFSPRASADGTMVSVPAQDLGRGRLALAGAGLPTADKAGWEIFQQTSGIGMNSFMQRVNKMVAMEGALERTIQSMENVASARVHLAPGERETFSQDRSEPRASVMITPRRGGHFSRSQAIAVRNLVAGGVPDISPEHITILTADGETILGSDVDQAAEAGYLGARTAIEERVARSIEAILTAHVGPGNVRVKVAAEISNDREVIIQESFDPEQQVARSTSALNEQSQSRDAGSGSVDVANNMPGVENGAGAGTGREESRNKSLDETVFEIGSTRSERHVSPGSIKRLTVAVLVNGRMEESGYVERTAEEIARLTALVRSASGIDEARGDEVAVDSLRFVQPAEEEGVEAGGGGMAAILSEHAGAIIRGLIMLAGLVLVLLLAVRPALARSRSEPAPDAPGETGREAGDGADEAGANELSDRPVAAANATPQGEMPDDEGYVALSSVSGAVMQRYLTELSGMIGDNREDAVRVLRSWIQQKA